jgi:hypothetical protein
VEGAAFPGCRCSVHGLLEIVFRIHLTDPADRNLGARRPRDNPDWPEVGIFDHRNTRLPSELAGIFLTGCQVEYGS